MSRPERKRDYPRRQQTLPQQTLPESMRYVRPPRYLGADKFEDLIEAGKIQFVAEAPEGPAPNYGTARTRRRDRRRHLQTSPKPIE
jgi:hypothetical protein